MPAFKETWNYDATGNWLQFNKNGTVENRTHNTANETQTICTHDRNGNMSVMPGLRGVYDAWNRMVEVRNASNVLLATYGYNGLNQRVRKTVGNVVTTSFFNREWQELESTTSNTTSVYVWGQRYIDDLLYRDKGQERLYALADPNWNVVAITNAVGAVQERIRYDGFGKITWQDANFATKGSSGFAWNRTFTGQVLDAESGLMLYRNRFYHTGLGRFVHRDPIGYEAGDVSLYRYVGNQPDGWLDPMGLRTWGEWARQTWDAVCKANDAISGMPGVPCVCALAGAADIFNVATAIPYAKLIDGIDCACNASTTLKKFCDGKGSALGFLAATALDCLSSFSGGAGDMFIDILTQAAQNDFNRQDEGRGPGETWLTDILCKCSW